MINNTISIALVDDSAILRGAIASYLSREGFNIYCEAGNGRDFLQKLAAADELPDMCLLDNNMPVMNGYLTAAQLQEKYPSVLIMAFSFFDEDSADKMLHAGARAWANKDIPMDELVIALKALHREDSLAIAC